MRGAWLALPVVALTACALFSDLGGFSDGEPLPANDSGTPAIDTGVASDSGSPDAPTGPDASDAGEAYRNAVMADAPVVYYRLADLGDDAKDERARKDARYVGGVVRDVESLVGVASDRAVTLDGTSGRIAVGAIEGLFVAKNPFTIEAWVRHGSGASGTDWIVGRDDTTTPSTRYGVSLFVNAAEGVVIERWADGGNTGRAIGLLPAATRPSHVAATYDGASLRVWVDGVPGDAKSSPITVPDNTQPIVIGSPSTQVASWFEGSIDEVALYDKVLPEPRIAAHYAAGKP